MYYICCTSWPDFLKLKIQESYLTFPPNMVTRDKEEGLCVVGKETWALEMSRPRSEYWLQY